MKKDTGGAARKERPGTCLVGKAHNSIQEKNLPLRRGSESSGKGGGKSRCNAMAREAKSFAGQGGERFNCLYLAFSARNADLVATRCESQGKKGEGFRNGWEEKKSLISVHRRGVGLNAKSNLWRKE